MLEGDGQYYPSNFDRGADPCTTHGEIFLSLRVLPVFPWVKDKG
jgi:hypothetical protein